MILFQYGTHGTALGKNGGDWTFYSVEGLKVLADSDLWKQSTLGSPKEWRKATPEEADKIRADGSLQKLTNSTEWDPLPAAATPLGVIEPAWLEISMEVVAAPAATKKTPTKKSTAKKEKAVGAINQEKLEPQLLQDGRTYYPSWVVHPKGGSVGMTDAEWGRLRLAGKGHDGSPNRSLLLVGGPGTAKTLLAALLAGGGYHSIDFSEGSDLSDVLGVMGWNEKRGTFYEWSPMVLAAQHHHSDECIEKYGSHDDCGEATVVANEINLLPAAYATALHGPLDAPSRMFIAGAGYINSGPDFKIIGTLNQYAGQLAPALASRFGASLTREVQWPVMEKLGVHPDVIGVARELHRLKALDRLDSEAPSPRLMFDVTNAIRDTDEANGGPLSAKDAFEFGMEGFLGSHLSELDVEAVQQTIQDRCSFVPAAGGRGSRQ